MDLNEKLIKRLIEAGALLAMRTGRGHPCRQDAAAERLLALLRYNPGVSEKALGEMLGAGPERLDRLLARMEALGLVAVEPGEEGRPMTVSLTALGERRAELAEKESEKTESLLGCLSEEERSELAGLLERLLARLREEDEGADREAFEGFFGGASGRPRPFPAGMPHRRWKSLFFGGPAF
jgi:DNA-binding MarR family transcriptional regulator